jgi:predicted lipoprotein with Yx(FWY)xxD motif
MRSVENATGGNLGHRRNLVSRTIAVPTVVLALGSALALAAFGSTGSSTIASARPTAGATPASNAPSVKASSSKYGKVLFDGSGRVLYTFARDRGKASTCYGGCARAWPPFTAKQAPKAGAGARSGLLGTTDRRDGSRQVTYAGHPLYYYDGDKKPGQISCQNVSSFGGLWLVINPNGTPVH